MFSGLRSSELAIGVPAQSRAAVFGKADCWSQRIRLLKLAKDCGIVPDAVLVGFEFLLSRASSVVTVHEIRANNGESSVSAKDLSGTG